MIEQASEKLTGILTRMQLDAEVVASEDAERVTLEVRGAESGLVIGKHGATLDALQYLVNKMVSQGLDALPKPVVVDAEGYRQRRADSLIELAQRLADKARKSGRPVAASPMSPADRRVMHLALADAPDVSTRSEGEGPARHLVILPGKKAALADAADEL
jgi:spoIIIJ-associated protein